LEHIIDTDKIDISIERIVHIRIGEKNTPWRYPSSKEIWTDENSYSLTYVKSGGIYSKFGNDDVEFKEGQLFLTGKSEIPYTNYSMKLPTILYVISFITTEKIPLKFYTDGRIKIYPFNPSAIEKLYLEALDLYVKKPPAWKISTKRRVFRIFEEFLLALNEKNNKMPSFLKTSLEYIDKNALTETININELALKSNVSPTHFSRVFRQHLGASPKKYINTIKIDSAMAYLVNTDKTILEICELSGFNDIAYFNRVFKEHANCSPSQYRKKNNIRIF